MTDYMHLPHLTLPAMLKTIIIIIINIIIDETSGYY